jgi:16S rRNA processing protein RimM
VVADILRARGNRGEVLADSQTDVPGRLLTLKTANVRLADQTDVEVQIENSWQHGEHWVVKFAGVDSIDDAEKFRGSELWIPREGRGALPEGEYFRSDLLGCLVKDASAGEEIGRVEGFQQYGGPLLLELRVKGREVLIPFVPEICRKVDLQAKTIETSLPEGLLDL